MWSLLQVLVGEEALLKKLKSYEKENEALKKKLAQVMMSYLLLFYHRLYLCIYTIRGPATTWHMYTYS